MSNFVRGASNLESMRTSITLADNQNNINHAVELERANPSKLAKFNSTALLSNVKNYLAQQSDNHANKKTFYDFVTSVYTNVVMNYVNPNNRQINISVQQEINNLAYSQVLADLLDTISLKTADLTAEIFKLEKELEKISQDTDKLTEELKKVYASNNHRKVTIGGNINKIKRKIEEKIKECEANQRLHFENKANIGRLFNQSRLQEQKVQKERDDLQKKHSKQLLKTKKVKQQEKQMLQEQQKRDLEELNSQEPQRLKDIENLKERNSLIALRQQKLDKAINKLKTQQKELECQRNFMQNPDKTHVDKHYRVTHKVNVDEANEMLKKLNADKQNYILHSDGDERVFRVEKLAIKKEMDYWQMIRDNEIGLIGKIQNQMKDLENKKEEILEKKDIDIGLEISKRTSQLFAEFITSPSNLNIVNILNQGLNEEELSSITGLSKSEMQEIITNNYQN